MTVNELIAQLQDLSESGYGETPVVIDDHTDVEYEFDFITKRDDAVKLW